MAGFTIAGATSYTIADTTTNLIDSSASFVGSTVDDYQTGDKLVVSGYTKYDTIAVKAGAGAAGDVKVVGTDLFFYTTVNAAAGWYQIGTVNTITTPTTNSIEFIFSNTILPVTDAMITKVLQSLTIVTNTTTGTISDDRALTFDFIPTAGSAQTAPTQGTSTLSIVGSTGVDTILYTAAALAFDPLGGADILKVTDSEYTAVHAASDAIDMSATDFEVLNASTYNNNLTVTVGAANTAITTGSGNDTIKMVDQTILDATIDGGLGIDTLQFTGAATVGAGFGTVSNVEKLQLADAVNSVIMGATDSIKEIIGGTGVDTIDASLRTVNSAAAGQFDLKITAGASADIVTISQGKDDINLGAGDDTLNIATANLTAADKIDGDAGTADKIILKTGDTTVTDAQFTQVTNFETLQGVAATTTLTLGDNFNHAGITTIDLATTAATGAVAIDMSSMADNSKAYTITTGTGGTTIKMKAANVGNDTITGDATATDILQVTTTGTITMNAGVTNFDTLKLTSAELASSTVTLDAANDFLLVDATDATGNVTIDATAETGVATKTLTINTGTGNDTVTTGATTVAVTIDTGLGNDTITTGANAAAVTIVAGDGNNTITLGTTDNTKTNSVTTGSGDDIINLGVGIDTIDVGGSATTTGDVVKVAYANFTTADTVTGSGDVTLTFTDATTESDSDADNIMDLLTVESKIAAAGNAIDTIKLGAVTAQSVTLGANAETAGITKIDGSDLTGALTVDLTAMAPASGTFTVKGGSVADTVKMISADLTTTTSIQGAGGDDILQINDVATILDADFTLSSSLEKLVLAKDGANSIILGDLARTAGIREIDASMDTVTVPATPATQKTAVTVNISAMTLDTNMTIKTGEGADTITMKGSQLTATDTISAGLGSDILKFTDKAELIDTSFTGVSKVETLEFANVDNQTVILGANAQLAEIQTIDADALTGTNKISIDASADSLSMTINTGTGDDTVTLGSGVVNVNVSTGANTVKTSSANLTSSDVIAAGAGTADTLEITTAASLLDNAFTGVSGFETLKLSATAAGQTMIIGAEAKSAGFKYINATNTGGVTITMDETLSTAAAAGSIEVNGGASTDKVIVADAKLATLKFYGAGGTDTIEISDQATIADADLANITSVEVIKLKDFTGQTVVLGTNAVTAGINTVDASGLTGVNAVSVNTSAMTSGMTITTMAGDDSITLGSGVDTVNTGDGKDTITIEGVNLTSSDTINGGANTATASFDTLVLANTAGTTVISDSAFTGISGIEKLQLATGTYTITLGAEAFGAGFNEIEIASGVTATIDMSAAITAGSTIKITGAGATVATIITGAQNEDITLGTGADTVKMTSAALTLDDKMNFGTGTDTLEITTAATIIDADFDKTVGLETIKLSNADVQSITLGDKAKNAGVNKVDLSGVTTLTYTETVDLSSMSADVTGGFTVLGGNGTDTIKINAEHLSSDDILNGGISDSDTLEFKTDSTTAAGVTDTEFTGVTNIEILKLKSATSVDQVLELGTEAFNGGAGIKTVNANGLTGKLDLTLSTASDITVTNTAVGSTTELTMLGASLTSADTLTASSDAGDTDDKLLFTDAATITDSTVFTNVTGFETLELLNTGAQTVTIAADKFSTVDASVATAAVVVDVSLNTAAIDITTGTGADTITLGSGANTVDAGDGADRVKISSTTLASTDHLDAGVDVGGGDTDILEFTTTAINSTDNTIFNNVTHFETLQLANIAGAQKVTLKDGTFATVNANGGSVGAITVDAAAVISSITINTGAGDDIITAGSGVNVISTGTGNDTINITASNLTLADDIDGGAAGTDTLSLTGVANLVDEHFTNITNIESIKLADATVQTIVLGTLADTNTILKVDASAVDTATDTVSVDISGYTQTDADDFVYVGGAGIDTFTMNAAGLTAADTLSGGGASDKLIFKDAANIATASTFTGVTGFETLELQNTGAQTVTLGADKFTTVTATVATGAVVVDASLNTAAITINTGIGGDTITLGSGANTVNAGDGADTIKIVSATLASTDVINGGDGADILELTTLINSTDNTIFNGVTNVETLELADVAGAQKVTLKSTNTFTTIDGSGVATTDAITLDATAITGAITLKTAGGDDIIIAGSGDMTILSGTGNDTIKMTASSLNATDDIDGGAAGTDTLEFTTTATLTDAAFTNITNIESIKLADVDAQTIVLGTNGDTNALLKVDASANTIHAAYTLGVDISGYTQTDADDFVYVGGAGIDTFTMNAAGLTAADTLNGGAGTADKLIFKDVANITNSAVFTGVTGFETIQVAEGDNQVLTLKDGISTTTLTVDATALTGIQKITIDGTLVGATTTSLNATLGGGADTVTLGSSDSNISAGAGDDTIKVVGTSLTIGDTIDGGAHTLKDTLEIITTADNLVDADFTNVSNMEVLKLSVDATQSLTLGDEFIGSGIKTIDAATLTTTGQLTVDTSSMTSDIDLILTGGALADTLKMKSADLTVTDTLAFGNGTDILEITNAATLIDADFTKVTSLDTIKVGNFDAQSLTLGALSATAGVTTVDLTGVTTNTFATTVDFKDRTADSTVTVNGSAGLDTVKMRAEDLTTADTLTGGTSGVGVDTLQFTTKADGVTDGAFTNVTGFETLTLADFAGQTIALGTEAFNGGAGIKTVNATALTGTNAVSVDMSGATSDYSVTVNTSVAGTGADTVTMKAAHLTSTDTLALGAGTADKLVLTTAATNIGVTAFTGVTGVEVLELQATTGTQSVVLGAGFTTVNASVATAAVTIDGATTASLDLSTITTGTGDDTLKLQNADFTTADVFAFGTGTDTLEITNAATITNGQFTNTTGLDTIKLGNFAGQTVALADLAIAAGVTKVDFGSITNTTYSTTTTLSGTADSTIKIIGGLGADSVTMRAEDLTLADTLTGSDGVDTLTFSTTATLLDAAFTEVTGFETLVLADANAQTLVLGNEALGGGIKTVTAALTGANTVSIDMSSATSDYATSITTGAGADTVTMKAAHLTSSDVLNGGAGNDTLVFTDAATLTADKFANVTSFKTLELQATTGTQNVALVSGFDTVVASVATAAVTIDASANGTTDLTITTGTGADTVKITASTLTAADNIEGGDGVDTLEILAASSIIDTQMTFVKHIEVIKLTNPATPTSITLGSFASANGINKIDASTTASVNTIDLTLMTTTVEVVGGAGADSVTAGSGTNTIKTGLGDDTVTIDATTLTSADIIWGEGGTDTLILTGDTSGLTADKFTNVTGFESIKLSDGTGISMILGADADLNNIVKVDASSVTTGNTITTDISGYEIVTDVDNFTYVGGAGKDTFKMQSTHLNKDDILSGGFDVDANVDGIDDANDVLEFTTVAINSTDSSIFNNVTGFETLKLADVAGAQTVTLKNGAFTTIDASANSNTGVITVDGSNVVGDITIKTAGGADIITAAKGVNTIQSGLGNDTIKVNSTTFDASDNINGGDGTDTIEFSGSKTTITDAMFVGKTSVESIKVLVDESGQVITLGTNANTAGINTVDATTLTKGITVDASGMTLGMTISTAAGDDIIKAGNGADTIKAGDGADTITIAASKLTSADVIWGEGGTADKLVLTGVATLDDSAFTGVKTIESLEIGVGSGQTITMGTNAIASGIKTIDTSKIGTGNTLSLDISAFDTLGAGGATKIIGGTGNETVTVKALTLDGNDDINLGTGTDKVIFSDVLTSAPTLTKLTGVETIQLSDGNNQLLTLNDDIGTTLTIDGLALVDINKVTIDGSVLGTKTTNFTVNTSTGADTITIGGSINTISAGGGDDTIKTAMANLTDADADTINGGSGTNTLEITTGGTLSDAKLLNVTNIQSVKLSPTVQADYNLTLGTNASGNDIVNIDGSSLTIGKLSIDASTLGNEIVNFKGGDANDTFIIAGAQLNSSDTIDGKSTTDTDILMIKDGSSTATTIIDSAFTNVTNIEKLTYGESANHSLTAGDQFKESGIKTVDASALATTKTFAMNLNSMTTDMDLTVVGSNGVDTITMKGTHLTALDVLKLGTGINVLELSGPATLTDINFAATSTGVTTIKFTENYAQDLTIGANAIAGGLTTIDATAVLTAGSSITVDSAVTANLTINTGGGIDIISLASGNSTVTAGAGDDIIKMTAANLTADDIINGGTHTSKDILQITTAGTLADTQFAHVTNIEEIKLSQDVSQSLTFGTNFTTSGIVSVDASALTSGKSLTLDISAMSIDKNMTVLGGAGDDTVTILGSSLDKNDKIVFGGGDDTLKIASASAGTTTITDEDFTNISGVETVIFTQYHNEIEFGDNMVVAGVVKIDASANTATGYTTKVDMTNMSEVLSTYELIGGTGDDTFLINANQLIDTDTKINGGDNNTSRGDTLQFNTSVVFDDANKFTGVSNIETIKLFDGDGQKIVLVDNLTSTLDGSELTGTNSVEVVTSALTSGHNITITTSGGADTVTLGAGADTVTLGAGNDTVTIASANLTSADTIDFGTGTDDTLILSTASELTDTDFTKISGLEKIQLADGANSLTLGDFAKASGLQEIDGSNSSGTLSLNMSSMTSNIDLDFTGGSGIDTITMKGIHFQQTDNLDGGAGIDILAISGNSILDDIAFTNASNIETLKLLVGTHNITLGTEAEEAGIVTIDTSSVGANNLSINISAITTNMTIDGQGGADTIIMGQGDDTVNTGAGDDTIKVASNYLTSTDTVNGAGNNDQLIFTTTISSTDKTIFNGVSNIEKLVLADGDGQKVTLKNGTFTTIDALTLSSSNAITIDATDVTTNNLNISTAGGDDVVIAGEITTTSINYEVSTGAGDDIIQFTTSSVITSADKVYGGAGNDTLEFTSTSTASSIVDTFFGTHITGIENLKLGNVTGNNVTLGAKATTSGITTIDTTSVATTKSATIDLSVMAINMTVNGGAGNDTVTAGTKNDTLNLGAGTDKVIVKNAQLNASDLIDGGEGIDTIEISDSSTVTDTMFTNVSNTEKLVLKGTAVKTVTLGEKANFSGLNEVDASTIGAVVVNINASAITGDFTIITAGGTDIITVGTGDITVDAGAGNDTIKMAGTTFDVNDTIDGGTGTGDILLFTDSAILSDAQLNKITGIETIKFSDVSGQSVEIGDNAKTNGLKNFDASAITSANSITMNLSSMATDENMVLTGGAGKDTFIMQAAHFTATDTLAGGAGIDTLEFTTAVTSDTAFDALFTKTTGIEHLVLADFSAQTFTLGAKAQLAGVASVDATALTANSITITASTITSALSIETAGGDDVIFAGNGLDSYKFGGGNDTITFKSASLNKDLVDGGEGNDLLIISDLANIVDASLANVSKIEKMKLSNATGDSKVTLGTFAQDAGILELDGSLLTDTSTINISDVTIDNFIITTGTDIDNITLGSGINTIVSGDGNDVITVRAEDFTSADKINGGSESDTIVISTASASTTKVTDTDFTNVTAVETIKLSNFTNQEITLGSNAKNAGITTLDATASGNIIVDLSAIEVSSFTTKTGKGNDTITLGKANDIVNTGTGSDTVKIKSVDLNSLDSILFGGVTNDTLEIIDAATIIDEDFTGIVGVDILKVGNFGSQTITVGTLASVASLDIINAATETNTISINAAGFTNQLSITTGSGNDSITLASSNLANFTLNGGTGTDTVTITDRANITDLKVANFTSVEKIVLADFNNQVITLGANASTIGLTTLDASELTTNSNTNINLADFTSNLTLTGGAGGDTVTIKIANTTSADTVALEDGNDTLIIADAVTGDFNDWLGTNGTNFSSIETLKLSNLANQTLVLGVNAKTLGIANVELTSAKGNAVTVNAASFASALTINTLDGNHTITTATGTHNDNITTGLGVDTITLDAGDDIVYTGSGNDTISISTTNLTSADNIDGGLGIDTLALLGVNSTTGAVIDSMFDTIKGIETIKLNGDLNQKVTIGESARLAGVTTVDASSVGTGFEFVASDFKGNLTLTGSANTDNITAGKGNDIINSGGGDDTIKITSTYLNRYDKLDGGASKDTLLITDQATITDDKFTGLKSIEVLKLGANVSGQTITLGAAAMKAGITTLDLRGIDGANYKINTSAFTNPLEILVDRQGGTFVTSSKNDTLTIDAGAFHNTVSFTAGLGSDTIKIDTAATGVDVIIDDDFTKLVGVETLALTKGGEITLSPKAVLAGIRTVDLTNTANATIVNAESFSNAGLNVILSQMADDVETGLNNDTITTTDANLTAADTIDMGTQLTKGVDTVYITDTASITSAELNKISNAEVLKLGNATGHSVNFTGTTNTTMVKVDGTMMKAGQTSLVNITGKTAQVEALMGAGNDTIQMSKADFGLYKTTLDQKTLTGGVGVDTILISDSATGIIDTDFIFKSKVLGFETIGLGAGGTVTIGANAAKAGIKNVDVSSSSADSIILTGGITQAVTVTLGNKVDRVETGVGADTVNIAAANLASTDKIWLGAGNDTLNITGNASGLDMTQMGGVVNVETLKLSDVANTNQTVNISSAGFYFVTFDASAMTSGTGSATVTMDGMTAKTTVLLGKGADTVKMLNADVVATTKAINGGVGIDTLWITNAATLTDASFAPKKIAAFETIKLAGSLVAGANFVSTGISNIEASGALTFTSTAVTKGYTVTGSVGNDTITLGTGADTIIGVDGTDTIKAGGGNDTFRFEGDKLTLADTVWGEAGTDTIIFTTAFTGFDSSFTGVKTVEIAKFNATTAQTLVYDTNVKASGITTIDASAVSDGFTLNTSGLADNGTLTFTGGAGIDIFKIKSASLTLADKFTGNAGIDVLEITDAATIIDSAFTNIKGVETLTLDATTTNNALTLGTRFQLSGITTINAATSTTGTNTIDMSGVSTQKAYNIIMGAAVDTITMKSAIFGSNVTIDGNGGVDIISISDKAIITDAQFALKTDIETIKVGNFAGNSITLAGLATTAGIVNIDGTAMINTTSNMTVNLIAMSSNKDMTLTGGAGNDIFMMATDHLTTLDTINGAGGTGDKLIISGTGTALGDADFTNVSNIETLTFATGSSYGVTFGAEAIAAGLTTIDAALLATGNTLTFTQTAGFNSALTVKGGAGNDVITTVGTYNDIITAGAGNDIITSGAGNDTLDGGIGDDKFIFGTNVTNLTSADKITGGTGTDIIEVTDAFTYGTQFALTTGVETLSLKAASTIVVNGAMNTAGFTTIDASTSAGALTIDASGTTVGLTIKGGTIADAILGSKGNDTITGGTGADTFKFTTVAKGNGHDTITDFADTIANDVTDDKLSLFFAKNSDLSVTKDTALHDRTVGTALSETDFNYYITDINYTDTGADIVLLGGDIITLTGINSGIDKTDFVYA